VRDTRIALATCTAYPALAEDDRLVIAPLAARGVVAEPAVWDDPSIDWSAYDVVVVRSTWDYVERHAEFLDWAARVPRLVNPADVLAWNTDKTYLRELAAAGVPVIDTAWLDTSNEHEVESALSADGRHVVKPSVSASARDTRWYELSAHDARAEALEHVRRIVSRGGTAMIQPYVDAVDVHGETAMLYVGGALSHAVRRSAVLVGPDGTAGNDSVGTVALTTPRAVDLEVAAAALDAVPGGPERLLYARVDLVDDADGEPRVLEVELTEPSLFLRCDDRAPDRFAQAIASRSAGIRRRPTP
jgi:hypothetical protein